MRILVAEDDPLVSLMIEDVLGDEGHQILGPVATASAALTLAEAHQPDLLLADINLADGRTGCRLAIEADDRLGIPALFVTGSPESAVGCDDAIGVLTKPFRSSSLAKAVEVVEAVLRGEPPVDVPSELRLFTRGESVRHV